MRSRGLLIVFSVAVLLPGLALAALGIQALRHERRLAAFDAHERLGGAADDVLREVENEFREWRWALERLASGTAGPPTLPASLGAAVAETGSVLVLQADEGGRRWWPQNSLLYSLAQPEDDRADVAVQGRPQSATDRAHQLHRRGRSLRDAGERTAAVAVFDQLREAQGVIGHVPAGLVGRYEACETWARLGDRDALARCALPFHRELVSGMWLLPPERYAYYVTMARAWLRQSGADSGQILPLERVEARKRALTEAVSALQATPCSASATVEPGVSLRPQVLAVRTCASAAGDRGEAALLVSAEWLARHVWPVVVREAVGAGYHVALTGPDGQAVFVTAAARPDAGSTRVARDGTGIARGLRVQLWPQDAARLAAASVARQRWYTGVLVLVAASLILGTYAMTRVVRRELQVASMKSDFVATVSHELRTPVTAIRQLGELLLRDRVPELRRREYYERITQESERLGLLIDSVLDFARMEAGRKQYDFRPLDTSTWLRQTLSSFRDLHEGTGLTLSAVIPDALPVLEADAVALGSAMHNLLDNAVKYSPGEPTVWVEAEQHDRGVTIRVRDQGMGIGDDERARVFDRFYRADRGESRAVRGAGLGLSLVHHIVAAHKGQVGVESRLGSGSTFSIHLPAASSRP